MNARKIVRRIHNVVLVGSILFLGGVAIFAAAKHDIGSEMIEAVRFTPPMPKLRPTIPIVHHSATAQEGLNALLEELRMEDSGVFDAINRRQE